MLSPEHEGKLQELFGCLDGESLEAVFALMTHLDESASARVSKLDADGELELKKDRRQMSEIAVGYYYGEAAGTILNVHATVTTIGRLLTCPIDPTIDRLNRIH